MLRSTDSRVIKGVLLSFLVLAGGVELRAAETIEVAAFEYPPIYQNGSDHGLSGDIAVAAFKAVDIDARLLFVPVARMINNVSSGQSVCALGGAVLFEESKLAEKVRIGSVIQYVSQTFFFDRREFPGGVAYTDLGQLRDYRIGVLFASGIARFLQKGADLNLIENTSHEGLAKQLYMRRIDLWATVDLTGHLYLKNLYPDDADRFERTVGFNRGDVSLVCSRKADPGGYYLEKFAVGLSRIKKNGTYMNIMARYYGGSERINRDSLPDDMR